MTRDVIILTLFISGGLWAAGNADITIAIIGFTPVYEGEEGDAFLAQGGGDRKNIRLPASQIAFMKALRKAHSKPIIAVVTGGSAIDLSEIEPLVDAIIYAWYPGEQGGNALADILFGKISPSGRLPVSFYQSTADLPPYESYAMQNRTYRYYKGQVQYPFGFGLSYSSFAYAWKQAPGNIRSERDTISFSVQMENTGIFDADETIQVYVEYPGIDRMPLRELKGFRKVFLAKSAGNSTEFRIPVSELKKWDLKERRWKLYPGSYTISIGKNALEMVLREQITIR